MMQETFWAFVSVCEGDDAIGMEAYDPTNFKKSE